MVEFQIYVDENTFKVLCVSVTFNVQNLYKPQLITTELNKNLFFTVLTLNR